MKFLTFIATLFIGVSIVSISCKDSENKNATANETIPDSTASANDWQSMKEEALSYTVGKTTCNSYIAYDSTNNNKRPIVLVIPEWWGLTEYPRMRAKQLARLGYLAVAVDIFGDGKIAGNPDDALKYATTFYKNPGEANARIMAALAQAKTYAQADTNQTAAIGYCFGGSMVLNAAKSGLNFDGVVSFHGGLEGVPAKKDLLKSKILVCHGEADSFVPQVQVDSFRKSLDSIGASYSFKSYANATHAFTNPDADNKAAKFQMPIKYNGAADTASWKDMQAFFSDIFQ